MWHSQHSAEQGAPSGPSRLTSASTDKGEPFAGDEEGAAVLVASHPLLGLLEPRLFEATLRASRVTRYRMRRTITREGEAATHAYFLLSGGLRAHHRSADGKGELLVRLLRAPALFGEVEVLLDRPHVGYVTTLEYSSVLMVPAELFRRLMRTQPRFAQALAVQLASRLAIATHHERALAFCDIDTRLAALLLDYAQMFGESQSDGSVRLWLSLSQQSMARDLGVSRKSLTRSLLKLKAQGVLSKKEARYVLYRLDLLKARTNGMPGLHHRLERLDL